MSNSDITADETMIILATITGVDGNAAQLISRAGARKIRAVRALASTGIAPNISAVISPDKFGLCPLMSAA
jgi:hypothetical protein